MNAFRDLQARSRHAGVDPSEVLDDLLGELARRDEVQAAPDSITEAHHALDEAGEPRCGRVADRIRALSLRLGDTQAGEAYGREVLECSVNHLREALTKANRKDEAQRAEISRLTDKVQDIQGRLAVYHGSYVATTSIAGKRYRILLVEDTDG